MITMIETTAAAPNWWENPTPAFGPSGLIQCGLSTSSNPHSENRGFPPCILCIICVDCIFVTVLVICQCYNGLVDPDKKITVLRQVCSSGKDGGVCAVINKRHSVNRVHFADK